MTQSQLNEHQQLELAEIVKLAKITEQQSQDSSKTTASKTDSRIKTGKLNLCCLVKAISSVRS
jgi:hypothetical protein